MKTATITYVKKTAADVVRVYDLSDVLCKGLEAACPVWTACRTKKAMTGYVDDYTTCDGYRYDSNGHARRINPTLCPDCVLHTWRGMRWKTMWMTEPLLLRWCTKPESSDSGFLYFRSFSGCMRG